MQNLAEKASKGDGSGKIFSSHRPRELAGGLSSGAKNVSRGVAAGVAAAVGMPTVGYRTSGAPGLAKGLCAGVVTGFALGIGGIATGLYQTARGVVYTPQYLYHRIRKDKIWCDIFREWIESNLVEDAKELPASDNDLYGLAEQRLKDLEAKAHDAKGRAMHLAALLGPAYEDIATRMNDKYNIDPNNIKKIMIQAAVTRYQKGVKLAQEGMEKTKEAADNSEELQRVTAVLTYITDADRHLGADKFSDLVGSLQYSARTMEAGFNRAEFKQMQIRRALRIAVFLAKFLDSDEFGDRYCETYVEELLTSSPAAPKLIELIGQVYIYRGKKRLSGLLRTPGQAIQAHLRKNKHRVGFAKATKKGAEIANKCASENSQVMPSASPRSRFDPNSDFNKAQSTINHMVAGGAQPDLPSDIDNASIREVLTSLCAWDIETSVARGCQRMLYDTSVSQEQQEQRAVRLQRFGEIMLGLTTIGKF